MRRVGGVPVLVVAALVGAPAVTAAQSYSSVALGRRLQGEERLDVRVEFAAGTIMFGPGPTSQLYRGRLVYRDDAFTPVTRYDARRRRLRIALEDGGIDSFDSDEFEDQELQLAISPAVPARLEFTFGASAGELELGGLSLERTEIKTGASETDITFSTPNRIRCDKLSIAAGAVALDVEHLANARCDRIDVSGGVGDITLDFTGRPLDNQTPRVTVKMGLGTLTLVLPEHLGVEIDLNRFIAGFSRSGFTKRGSRYYSRNYDDAPIKLRFEITAVFGDVDVVWVSDEGE